jgi:hypothetical protein
MSPSRGLRLAASKSTDAGVTASELEASLDGRRDQQRTVRLNEISIDARGPCYTAFAFTLRYGGGDGCHAS